MATRRVHCMIVKREGPEVPATFAVLSDLDLARVTGDGALDDVTAGDVAGSPLITVWADETLQHVAGVMARHACTHLLVIGRGTVTPLGVLSTLDIAAAIAGLEAPGLVSAAAPD